jgi:hypothetical protein
VSGDVRVLGECSCVQGGRAPAHSQPSHDVRSPLDGRCGGGRGGGGGGGDLLHFLAATLLPAPLTVSSIFVSRSTSHMDSKLAALKKQRDM